MLDFVDEGLFLSLIGGRRRGWPQLLFVARETGPTIIITKDINAAPVVALSGAGTIITIQEAA